MKTNGKKQKRMCIRWFIAVICVTAADAAWAQTAPKWVTDKNTAFPDKEWLAVVAEGESRAQAETAAMNALARSFEVDLKSLSTANQQFANIVNEAAGKKSVSMQQSQSFAQEVTQASQVSGLIGVEVDTWSAANGTIFFIARMNRKGCASRYHAMMSENERNIVTLIEQAKTVPATFDSYACLSFASRIAEVNDNFQNIAHVLNPVMDSRFAYGNADAVKTLARQTAQAITIRISVTGDSGGRIVKAFGSFFSNRGFKTTTGGKALYTLTSIFALEKSDFGASQKYVFLNYTLDAVVSDNEETEVFSYSGNGRKGHSSEQQVRQLVLRAAESLITDTAEEDGFAGAFEAFLTSLL